MILHIFNNAEEIGKAVANLIIEQVNEKPDSVLGFATGASPVPTYKSLIKAYNKGKVSFKDITTFNLDEYCDLPVDDKNSYYTFMHENLFNHIDVKEENVNFLNGNAEDTDAECVRYDDLLTENKIDIQLLGVGRNGHIGFNEPANKFTKGSFKVRLTQSTIDANSIYFDENPMPHYALTMGTVSIMKSKQIILIATGRGKADAIDGLVNGDISPSCPASVLQLHPNVHIFLDKAAASLL
ncbi:MAG: glucosamine-6-phosphate deaminase [Clostridia bacterium]|nr:glucosamine-6-phosphate deaminase [Clostridia bacterium]